eukprot:TRINITY_DN11533_c0_g1_i1.p4 TRINITY_DN11533_c0_g1~~TRINITY_DN11533_c0_g1_i1.p4  ORF type:complete len:109 (-),score=1.12 TRINITY_DN11533_c0_g1_i1:2495-2821(-)
MPVCNLCVFLHALNACCSAGVSQVLLKLLYLVDPLLSLGIEYGSHFSRRCATLKPVKCGPHLQKLPALAIELLPHCSTRPLVSARVLLFDFELHSAVQAVARLRGNCH